MDHRLKCPFHLPGQAILGSPIFEPLPFLQGYPPKALFWKFKADKSLFETENHTTLGSPIILTRMRVSGACPELGREAITSQKRKWFPFWFPFTPSPEKWGSPQTTRHSHGSPAPRRRVGRQCRWPQARPSPLAGLCISRSPFSPVSFFGGGSPY